MLITQYYAAGCEHIGFTMIYYQQPGGQRLATGTMAEYAVNILHDLPNRSEIAFDGELRHKTL